jgi:hypothetical protein
VPIDRRSPSKGFLFESGGPSDENFTTYAAIGLIFEGAFAKRSFLKRSPVETYADIRLVDMAVEILALRKAS